MSCALTQPAPLRLPRLLLCLLPLLITAQSTWAPPLSWAAQSAETDQPAGASTADLLLATDDDPLGLVPSVGVGISSMYYRGMDRGGLLEAGVLGPAAFFTLAYNTGFFLRPFLDVSYLHLYSSRFSTAYGDATGRSSALAVVIGPSYRRFGLRFRGGMGSTFLSMSTQLGGVSASTGSQFLTQTLGVSGKVLELGKFWGWLEGRVHFLPAAGTTVFSLSLTLDYGGWLQLREQTHPGS